jgi:type IV secretory pathway TraG/TraD family ATPase VirD4
MIKLKKFFCFGANVISFTACRKIYFRLFFVMALTFVVLPLARLYFVKKSRNIYTIAGIFRSAHIFFTRRGTLAASLQPPHPVS